VEFFCYHRDRPGSAPLRAELTEAHWSYMDGYVAELIARGPTLAGETPTGSVHIADLPDAAAAREFAFAEPGYQAGAYRDVLLRRWRSALGRTMWEFPGELTAGYLVLGLGVGPAVDLTPPASVEPIAYGSLWSDDETAWLGTAALVPAPDADTARGLLTADRYATIEVHHWEPGGRR
jgi:uncharacterized protein YciI